MTKNCKYKDCQEMIQDNYEFCYSHFQAGRKTDMTAKSVTGQWHELPDVDQLMKINNNITKITKSLERIADALEGNSNLLPPQKGILEKGKFLQRTKDTFIEDEELDENS